MPPPGLSEEPEAATLTFHEQADGRKVSRLPGGKVVLIELSSVDKVKDGETWDVRLAHKDTFAIAIPVGRAPAPRLAPKPTTVTTPVSVPISTPTLPVRVEAPKPREPAGLTVRGMLIEPENLVRHDDRVALFVDGANMDWAAREAGYFIDFAKARDYFVASGSFYGAFYYVADFTASDALQQGFLDALSHRGFIIRKKPVKVIFDQDTGERTLKGNLDTEIVLDMLNTVDNYDVAVLFSGDSDFERAVELLRSRGKRVYVVASRRSLSRELGYVADKPVFFLEDFRAAIERESRAV